MSDMHEHRRRGPRVRRAVLALAAAVVVLAGCGDSDQVDDAAPVAGADGIQREVRPLPPLDVETLTATSGGATVSAEQHPGDTYVGAVTDDLFIAVAIPEPSDDTEASATVYLCDSSEISEWLRGDVGTEPTTITGETLTVELARSGGVVEGQVSLDDGSVHPFIAEQATGDAGLYTLAVDDPTVLDGHDGDAAAMPTDQPTDHRIAGAVTVDLRAGRYIGGWIIL